MKYIQADVSARSSSVKQELWPQYGIQLGPNTDAGKPGEPDQVGCIPTGNPPTLRVGTVKLETLQVKQYDSIQEALADPETGGEAGLIKTFNVQSKTTQMNKCRTKYTGEVSESEIESRAIQLMFRDPQWAQAAQAAAVNDPTGAQFDALKRQAMDAIRTADAQAASQRAQAQAQAGQTTPNGGASQPQG